MKIGKQIEIRTTKPRIIPVVIPKREKPAEEPAIPAPNWPVKEPEKVPVTPEKEK